MQAEEDPNGGDLLEKEAGAHEESAGAETTDKRGHRPLLDEGERASCRLRHSAGTPQ